ncbi:MAG: hypothetical protein IK123_04310, partial [Lachnospiraceae bacterium]|nr:hypothetical protein [Lachnospiraceae bacterium]
DREYDYISTGLMEKVSYAEDDHLLYDIGYVMTDISGDGIPELIIGYDDDIQYDDLDEQSYILSVYTVKNKEPFCVIEGWARNSYR